MTAEDPLVRAAARLLRGEDAPPRAIAASDRARSIVAMERARDAKKRRRAYRWLLVPAAAAALIASVGIARRKSHVPDAAAPVANALDGRVVLFRGDKEIVLSGSVIVAQGDRIVAPVGGRAGVVLPTGTQLLVDSGGDLALLSMTQSQTLYLGNGAMRADVAKLRAGERFVVQTADAEIEVRGTSFRVERVTPDPACGAHATRVVVYEGIVVVRSGGHEDRVAAGQSWPRCTPKTEPIATTSATVAALAPAPTSVATAPLAPPKATVSPKAESDLVEQNDLYAAALAAKKQHDAPKAVSLFDRLLQKYPGGALAEQAEVERMKLLAGYDRPRAVEAARAYLARHPKGYARAEAEALVEKGP